MFFVIPAAATTILDEEDIPNQPRSSGDAISRKIEWIKQEEQNKGTELVEIIDLDQNGFPEIRKLYFLKDKKKTIARKEIDLNGDGKFDVIRLFDQGDLLKVLTDLDYDGKADIVAHYRKDPRTKEVKLVAKDYDFQMNGKVDLKKYYVNGQLFKKETDRNQDGTPDRFDYYSHATLIRTEFDENGDGIIDRWGENKRRFSYINKNEEEKQKRLLKQPFGKFKKVRARRLRKKKQRNRRSPATKVRRKSKIN